MSNTPLQNQQTSQRASWRALVLLVPLLCLMALGPVRAELSDGDITGDGTVDMADYLQAVQGVLGLRSLPGGGVPDGDVAPLLNGVPDPDGVFNTADVMVLLRMILYGINFSYPSNQFNIGDSIGEGEAADGTIGEPHHESVWSTGYAADVVNSLNERFESLAPVAYDANNDIVDVIYNKAASGAVMANFVEQAQAVVTDASQLPGGRAGMVTFLLGSNDVCAASMDDMTDPQVFEAQFRAGLDVLAGDESTRFSQVQVIGIPAIYWLWTAKLDQPWCTIFAWSFVPCDNLLDNPADDCESESSRNNPDIDYPDDGANCQRRKQFHRIVRDEYNTLLNSISIEYRENGLLPNIRYTDVYDVPFTSIHVNGGGGIFTGGGDCFHPSREGHALLADEAWCRSHWGIKDDQCSN